MSYLPAEDMRPIDHLETKEIVVISLDHINNKIIPLSYSPLTEYSIIINIPGGMSQTLSSGSFSINDNLIDFTESNLHVYLSIGLIIEITYTIKVN